MVFFTRNLTARRAGLWCAAVAGCVVAGVFAAQGSSEHKSYSPNPDLAAAPAGLYRLDGSHSHMRFSAAHYGGVSFPMLTFRDFQAEYQYDPKHPENTVIKAQIALGSLESGTPDFNIRMNQAGYFLPPTFKLGGYGDPVNAVRFITFETKKIEFTGKNKGKMIGDMFFYGVTRPITLDFTYNGYLDTADPSINFPGGQKMGFSANGSFKRSEFGMTAIPSAGDEVKFILEMEFHRQVSPDAAAARH